MEQVVWRLQMVHRVHQVTQPELHRHFHSLGAGVIEEVRVQQDKRFGFVRYNTHAEAALTIQIGNNQSFIYGKPIKCSWGNKPTPAGTSSNPMPPPAPIQGFSDPLVYEHQLAMSKMSMHAFMHPQAALGTGRPGASGAIYDGRYQNVPAAQQLMYYHQQDNRDVIW